MRLKFCVLLLVLLCGVLAGCGGGGGGSTGQPSSNNNGNPGGDQPLPGNGALAAPTGVIATAGNGQVLLSWTAVPGATSYKIGWSAWNGQPQPAITGITSTSYRVTGLTNKAAYSFYLVAVNGATESAPSRFVTAVPDTNPVTFSAGMVSGKTFAYSYTSSASGGTTSSDTVTFNSNGTFTLTSGSGTWSINPSHQLVMTFANEVATMTLWQTTGTVIIAIVNSVSSDGVIGNGSINFSQI